MNLSNISYVKGEAGKYIARAIANANTIQNISFYSGFKNGGVLQAVNFDGTDRNATDDWTTDSSNSTFKGVDVLMKRKEVVETITATQLETIWDAANYPDGSMNYDPSTAMQEAAIENFSKKVAQKVENKIWNATASTGDVLGFIGQALADSDVIDVAGITISVTNVEDEIQKVYDALPLEVIESGEAVIYLNPKNLSLYRRAIASKAIYNGTLTTGNVVTLFHDPRVMLVGIAAIGAKTMLATHKSNIAFLTDAEDDFNSVEFINLKDSGQGRKYRLVMAYKYDCKLIWGAEVVLYGTGL